ncbi:MAG: cytochrome c [Alphaproteobacteria bacterium]|nr:cytochrome c [Alphaproteobacteria bacterium]
MTEMLKFRKFLTAGGLAAVLLFAPSAQAAGDPVEAIKYRQMVMSSNGAHIGAIAAVLKGKVPHGGHILGHARAMHAASLMLDDIFPPGSDVGETRAKPEIWQQPEKFKAAIRALQTAVAGLVTAAESGDMGAIGDALGPVGKGCGGCHKPFRKPKE